jgi:hypothetical protein
MAILEQDEYGQLNGKKTRKKKYKRLCRAEKNTRVEHRDDKRMRY